MNYDGRVLHATTIILDSGDLSWSCRKKTVVPKKRVVPKKKIVPEKTDVVKKETWWEKLGGTNLASPADILRRASRVPSVPFGSCMLCNLWDLSSFVIRACRQLPSKYGAFLVAFSLHRTLLVVKICAVRFCSGDFRFACFRNVRHSNMAEGEIALTLRSICQKSTKDPKLNNYSCRKSKLSFKDDQKVSWWDSLRTAACSDMLFWPAIRPNSERMLVCFLKKSYFFVSSVSELFSESVD